MENFNIKTDLGVFYIKDKPNDIYQQIRNVMGELGYNILSCDICSLKREVSETGEIVLFKFVHYTVPTMVTEPYFKIEFKYE